MIKIRVRNLQRESLEEKPGFTLNEIMLVVAVISVLVLLAAPNFLRSRMTSNETVALSSLKTIYSGCQLYYNNNEGYPSAGLQDLANSSPSYIDSALGSGTKQGYQFIYLFIDANHFTVNANPVAPGRTGDRYFFIDETGVIHAATGAAATVNDPAVS